MSDRSMLRAAMVFLLVSGNATGSLAQSPTGPRPADGTTTPSGSSSISRSISHNAKDGEARGAGAASLWDASVAAAVRAQTIVPVAGARLAQVSAGETPAVRSGPSKTTIVAVVAALAGTVAVAAWVGQKRSQAAMSSGSGGSCSSRVTVRSAGGLFDTMTCRF